MVPQDETVRNILKQFAVNLKERGHATFIFWVMRGVKCCAGVSEKVVNTTHPIINLNKITMQLGYAVSRNFTA